MAFGYGFKERVMKIKLLPVALLLALSGCSDPQGARKALEDNGYTNVRTNGYSFFMCGERDIYSTEFRATSPAGKDVSGAVCSGILKGSTIRFD